MKRAIAAAAVAAFGFVGTTSAADMPVKARSAPAPLPPPFSWTGFYMGVNAGYGWSDQAVSINGPWREC